MTMRKFLLIAAVAASGCAAVTTATTALDPATWDSACKGAAREIAFPLSGDSAVDCGFLSLDASDKDFYHIMRCAQLAIQGGQAYRFGYQNLDEVFGYCNAAVHTPDGQLWSLQFYAPVDEIMGRKPELQYRFNAKRCGSITVLNNRRGFFKPQDCSEATDALMKSLPGASGG
jgi:hypothetical protein